jgi:sugar phosphate isomerase/epimerase
MDESPSLLFSTAPFFRNQVKEGLRRVAEAGYRKVEVMVNQDPLTQEAHLLRPMVEKLGLSVEVVHAPFLLLTRRVFGTDPMGKIYRSVQLAEQLGASLVVIHPPYRWQVRFRRWVEESLAEFSAVTGVAVAVENMFPVKLPGRGVTFHAGQELDDLDRYPYLVLDTSHAAVAGLDILGLYERYRDKLLHIHLSNNAGRGWDSHLPVYQEGVLPLGRFLGVLAGDGFAGTISLELDLRPYAEDEREMHEVLVRNREFCEAHLDLTQAGEARG